MPEEPRNENLFPYDPLDRREFWCEKLKAFVKLTGDVDALGIYWVYKVGESTYRRYGIKASDLSLEKNIKEEESPKYLNINEASWSEIKNFIIQFINSFPWISMDDKSSMQIKEEMLNLAKSRNQGLANILEKEKSLSKFASKDQFIQRMNDIYPRFPWKEFSEILDF